MTGRVQGVFFRAWTQEQAGDLGVSGWVRNRPDGSVEAHLEGSEQAVAELVENMRRGPSGAEVQGCDVSDTPFCGFSRFDVRR